MKNLNKVLAMLVVFMMMISTVAFAASSFTDVADTSSYSTAIEVGVDLGLIKGYTDGTFAPEGEITRAEFAAIVVRLLGQEAQAEGAKAATQFVDVPADHWAAGYVNIAVQAGVINGYGDGNFGPEDLVEYQDAITMMVRALGYEPAIGSAGYPTGYLTKAGDLGLTKNVNGTNGVAINRGAVAQIAFNALDVPLMTQSGYGTFTQYVINDGYSSTNGTNNVKKTLLSENHSTVKVQGVILSSTDSTSASVTGTDKVTVNVTNYLYNKFGIGYDERSEYNDQKGKNEIVVYTDAVMEVGTSDALDYVGKKCVIFVERDEFQGKNTVKAIYEVTTDDDLVVNLTDIEDFNLPNGKAEGNLKTEDFKVKIDKNAKVYYNGIKYDDVESTKFTGNQLRYKSGTVELALLGNTTADYDTVYITAYDVVVVKEVRPSASRVVAKTASDSQLNRIEYDETDGDVKATLLDANGAAMDWADLEENDVVIVKYVKAAKELIEAQVANNTVTGTVTEIDTSSEFKYAWIDGTEYKVLSCAEKLSDIKIGDEGTYYLTDSGIVYHEASASLNTNYAYVIDATNADAMKSDAKLKLLTKDGIATYDVDSKIYVTDLYDTGKKDNDKAIYEWARSKTKIPVDKNSAGYFDFSTILETLITFDTNANGVITAIELPLDKTDSSKVIKAYDDEDVFTKHTSKMNLENYDPDDKSFGNKLLSEDTVIFDVSNKDKFEWDVVALAKLAEDDVLKDAVVYNIDEDGYMGAIVVHADSALSGSMNAATFVTGVSEAYDDEGDLVRYLKGYVNGEEVVYTTEVAKDTLKNYVGTLVVPVYASNGDVSSFTQLYDKWNNGKTTSSNNYATAIVGNPSKQDSGKSRITMPGYDEDIKVPASANVYVYEANSTKRVPYTTDAYVGYVEYDEDGTWGWYIDEDRKDLTVKVYMYEFDGDIVDVVYYVNYKK